jgi:TetR/AcrR family transcriptional regulator, cholesterol catabolism regulator
MATQRRKRTNKKAFVRDTAAKLFMDHGYRGTTMDLVAETTGLNKGTLYFYYKSKAEILYEIYDLCGTLIVGRTTLEEKTLSPLDGVRALVRAIIQTVYEHQIETTVYFRQEAWLGDVLDEQQLASVRMKQKAFNNNCKRVFDRAKAAGVIADLPTEDYFHVFLGATSWAYRWIKKSSSPEDIAERMSNILIDGMRVR